jgi:NADPH:quinone reductase-like Zn-dependent oxidoreductase
MQVKEAGSCGSQRQIPDAANMRSLAEEIANGKFKTPIDRMIPLADASDAHAEAEKGGMGKVLLLV